MGFGGGGGGDQDVTQTTEPWSGVQPHLRQIYGSAQQLFESGGPQYFPEPTVVPFSPMSAQALAGVSEQAIAGSPEIQAARQAVYDTAAGNYLNANPYLDATYEQAMRGILPGINATFGTGGRTGSYAHSNAVGSAAADLATNIYGQNYQDERTRMLQAAGLAPGTAEAGYYDLNQLYNVGQAVEGKAGEYLADQIARYDYYQNLPYSELSRYSQYTTPGQGFSTTTTEGIDGNPLLGGAGGFLAGAGASGLDIFSKGGRFAGLGQYLPWVGLGLGALSGF